MNRSDVENGIYRAWDVLGQLCLAETFSTPAPLEVDDEFRRLALSDDTTYTSLYLYGLSASQYNIMLLDYSYLQFGWSGDDNVRYAYYPNPYIVRSSDIMEFQRLRKLLESGVITAEEYFHLLDGKPSGSRVPLLRYENAPAQFMPLRHPCSHFHIGHHAENRWPANRILTPLAFTLLVCKNYYSEEWFALGDDEMIDYRNTFDKLMIEERQKCRAMGEQFFTADEARSFHFA